jgi:hypothetical protein
MYWKAYGRKQPWPNFKHYLSIYLEGLRKTMKTSSQYSQPPGFNPERPGYEAVC